MNPYEVMSQPTTCVDARARFHGVGNRDRTLGATSDGRFSRFSNAAAALMALRHKISVETGLFDDDDGFEM